MRSLNNPPLELLALVEQPAPGLALGHQFRACSRAFNDCTLLTRTHPRLAFVRSAVAGDAKAFARACSPTMPPHRLKQLQPSRSHMRALWILKAANAMVRFPVTHKSIWETFGAVARAHSIGRRHTYCAVNLAHLVLIALERNQPEIFPLIASWRGQADALLMEAAAAGWDSTEMVLKSVVERCTSCSSNPAPKVRNYWCT